MPHVPTNESHRIGKRVIIDAFLGGAFQAVARHGDNGDADAVVIADTLAELDTLDLSDFHCPVILLALAEGETSRSLMMGASANLQAVVQNLGGMNAKEGLGQARAFSAIATRRQIAAPEFALGFEQLRDILLQRHNGDISAVLIRDHAGIAGGTGYPGAMVLSENLAQRIEDSLNVPVEIHQYILGGITAIGLGPRVLKNAAPGLVDAFGFLTDPSSSIRQIRRLTMFELPPVGRDRERRDGLVRQMMQALRSPDVERLFQIINPNDSLNSWLGNARQFEADYFRALDPVLDVAPQVAFDWERAIQEIFHHATSRLQEVASVEVELSRQELLRDDIPAIVDNVLEMDEDDVLDAIVQPAYELTSLVKARLRHGESLPLDNVGAFFALPPDERLAARKRLQLQRSLITAIGKEISTQSQERDGLKEDLDHCHAKVVKVIRSIQSPGVVRRTVGSVPHSLARLEDAASEMRSCNDQLQELEAQLAALDGADNGVAKELQFLEGRLRTMTLTLGTFQSPTRGLPARPLVVSKTVDYAWKKLWRLDAMPPQQQLSVLVAGVDKVTITGLATICDADPDRLETIAERIARGTPVTIGPPTGGKKDPKRAVRIHVLPPLETDVAVQLSRLIKQVDASSEVAFTGSAKAGANVVRLRAFAITRLEEAFSGLQRQSLKAAWNDEQRDLFFPFQSSYIDALGIEITDKVTFKR